MELSELWIKIFKYSKNNLDGKFSSQEGADLFPKDANDKLLYSDVSITETWKAMEKLVEQGLVKSIGVSNFNSKQIDEILSIATVKPVVNQVRIIFPSNYQPLRRFHRGYCLQVECHPYLNQTKLKEFCASKGILLTAYSPLGSPDRPWAPKDEPSMLEDPKIVKIAEKYKKSPAQILIRYQVSL